MHKLIDLSHVRDEEAVPIRSFGGDNGKESLSVNRRYFVRDGRPFFPVMGEFHFSRYPAAYWEESLRKMQAGGVRIVATYVIWIHHEEEQGVFDWSGNKDLRRFIGLCRKTGMRVLLRIGPWSHGECRNGGFPDWLVHEGIPLRENNARYLSHVRNFYTRIFGQVDGEFFADGGPIVGVQIENEYGHCGGLQGEPGIAHMKALKDMAVEIGFVAPFYTSTGWGNGVVVEGETLPVLGGYAEAPWDQHTHERKAAPEYLFSPVHRETEIGTDLAGGMLGEYAYDITRYPYLTAELGGGLEPTHHRRPIVSADDTGALVHAFLGSGANLLGYYMYHGGTNPTGKFSTFQESRATGYLNDVPELSYDFQAPIGEYGFPHESYGRLKALHLFLQDFGEEMALSVCHLGEDNATNPEDMDSLRYCVRYGSKGGFLFLSNYQRRRHMTDKPDVGITVATAEGTYVFEHIHLPDGRYVFYPFAMDLDGISLETATAQPLCRIQNGGRTTYVFLADEDMPAVYRFRADTMRAGSLKGENLDGLFELHVDCADWGHAFALTRADGRRVGLLTINRRDAYRAWKVQSDAGEHLVLTDAMLRQEDGGLTLTSVQKQVSLLAYPALPEPAGASLGAACTFGDFTGGTLRFEEAGRLPAVSVCSSEKQADGAVDYTLSVTRSRGEAVDDDRLTIRFEGDRARLFIDGAFAADWFYMGTDWTVGLKRFGELEGHVFRLHVEPLKEDDPVFLEKRPAFENGVACALRDVQVAPEYICRLRLKKNAGQGMIE